MIVRPLLELLGDLLGQRPVGLHLVDVDAEQRLEVLGRRLEERPLIAFEVHPDEVGEGRQGSYPQACRSSITTSA